MRGSTAGTGAGSAGTNTGGSAGGTIAGLPGAQPRRPPRAWYEWCVNETFEIPLWAGLLAVGVGAMQGAMFAAQFRDRRLDLLGVAIIGLASGFGGGIVRDVVLSEVPAVLTTNWYLIVATGAALFGMLLERLIARMGPVITVLDALTIGLFGAIGTTKALAMGLPEVPAIFVGAISGVGGSILRDMLLSMPIALMHVGSLYAVAAVSGATSLVIMRSFDVPVLLAASICVAITVGVRVLAVLFNWTLPEQRTISRLPKFRRP
ncbi:putative membrane protein YeiH [Salinibacterium amurskyense]|uniref:Putative membrane protein YeiH n=1 Tax=Salinibacterium amurskyense TaxID=205941 RepID=A0A2M9D8X9_9MICO|nr:putative membrane protein YeiH [Salinibacterium amurskyense]GHD77880.1 membrane protein [Salinibacterium amurskyense]